MQSVRTPASEEGASPERLPAEPALDPRNFWAWVAYQFFYRIGWQFKMESTLMAGVVTYLTGSPTVMGIFTTCNNVGRNLSPLVAAPVVDRFRQKRGALLFFWGGAVVSWIGLTLYLWLPSARNQKTALWVFGACYTLFFLLLGASSVAQGALLGKVIPAGHRGRAMAVGMGLSGAINVFAILLVYWAVQSKGFPEPLNYALSFTLTSGLFVAAGLSLLWIREEPSEPAARSFSVSKNLRHFVKLGRANSNLARLMVVNIAVGIGGSMLQFYTAYWRESGSVSVAALPQALLLATVLQVFWQSLSSNVMGRAADRRGNRKIICGLLWIEAVVPIAALVLGGMAPFRGHWAWYLGVYVLIGARFPVYQLLVNYLLEVVPQHDHAMALGAVNAVQLVTAPAPLLLGGIAQLWGFEAAFVIGSAVLCVGAVTALGLEEVRIRPIDGVSTG
ncbi:MAG: MFS transporter [Armatimonadota bacterium]